MISLARREMLRAARLLGDSLLDDIRASLLAILDFPAAFPSIDSVYRRKLLDAFPYALVYRIDGETLSHRGCKFQTAAWLLAESRAVLAAIA